MTSHTHQPITADHFMRLFLRHEREIFRYVSVLVPNVEDAQDIVQETAVALWKKIDQYDPDQPFVPWACRFALLEVRQNARRRDRWPAVLEGELMERLLERREKLSERMDRRREHLRHCIQRLSEDQRRLIQGYYYERLPVTALAGRVGRSKDAVYKALQRIRRALSECVDRRQQGEGAA